MYFQGIPVMSVTVRVLRCSGSVFLMGMINMDDKVSRYFSSRSGIGTKFHLPYSVESYRVLPAWFCCGMWHGALQKSVRELPGNSTQWNEHKTPQFEPRQRGNTNLVVKLLAETEHGRQGASVNLQGIPGFLSSLSAWKDPEGVLLPALIVCA